MQYHNPPPGDPAVPPPLLRPGGNNTVPRRLLCGKAASALPGLTPHWTLHPPRDTRKNPRL